MFVLTRDDYTLSDSDEENEHTQRQTSIGQRKQGHSNVVKNCDYDRQTTKEQTEEQENVRKRVQEATQAADRKHEQQKESDQRLIAGAKLRKLARDEALDRELQAWLGE